MQTTRDLGITAHKDDDFSEWYTQVVTKAQLADYSSAKGFMVLMPYGFSIWEKIKEYLTEDQGNGTFQCLLSPA